jgi:pyruvate carboxylase
MTLFMLANNLTPAEVLDPNKEIAFPDSVIEFFEGRLGQPVGGFPKDLQAKILRGKPPLTERAGASLPPADFDAVRQQLESKLGRSPEDQEVLDHLLYPRVFADFVDHVSKYSDTSGLPTAVFFYGMETSDEVQVEIEPGKTLVIKFLTVGEPTPDGYRPVYFELNGQPRDVLVVDKKLAAVSSAKSRPKAESGNPLHVGAPMPGALVNVAVSVGDSVVAGQKLLTLEAMKMETTLVAERAAKVAEILIRAGTQVNAGDLLIRLENS